MDNNIHNSQNDPNDLEWKNSFSKLNDWDSLPPLDGWDKISEQLDKPSRPKFLYWFLALGLILFSGIGSGIYLNRSDNNNSEITSVNTIQIAKEEKNQISEIEKLDNNSIKEKSVGQSNDNQTTKSNLSQNQMSNSAYKAKKISSNKTVSSKTTSKPSKSFNPSKNVVEEDEDKKQNTIVFTTDLGKNKDAEKIAKVNQENPQTLTDDISKEDKKLVSVLEEIPLGEIKINADPFFEMQIDSIKITLNDDKIDSLNKNNASLPKKSDALSKWKIASYTGFGLTYKHFRANPNDNHYVKMLNEKQTISERQSLTFGFMAEKELSKKWNLHADIGILKWKNTVQYDFWGKYYSAPTKYIATKISNNHISIQPIYENRDSLQTETLNYETTYLKADLGISYSLFQSKKWKHQIGLKTGVLFLTNENTNYTTYQNTTQFSTAKSVIPFFAGFHQTHYQLTNHWGIFGESSLKYLPNSVGDKNTIWRMRFYQINLHLGISYNF